jgi:TPR repeat protein
MRRLLQAAERGDADAQFNLAILYHTGNAAAGGRAEAIKWLLEAAEQGLPRAQAKLAELLAEVPDAAGSHVQARAQAQAGYERVAAGLTPADIAAVTTLAQRWKPARAQDELAAPLLPERARRRIAK